MSAAPRESDCSEGARPGRRPLVVGLGNPDRGDDGVGAHVLAALRVRLATPSATGRFHGPFGELPRVVAHAGGGLGLLDLWEDTPLVIVVDALRSGDPPGTVHRYDVSAAPLPVVTRGASTHDLGLAECLELARTLGRLPPRVIVLGVEARSFEHGEPLGEACSAATTTVVRMVLDELARFAAGRRAARPEGAARGGPGDA